MEPNFILRFQNEEIVINIISDSNKESEQERILLKVLCSEFVKALENVKSEKNRMEFERDNATTIQRNMMQFLDYSTALLKELEEVTPSKSIEKKEYSQERYFLLEIILILNRQITHLESVNQELEKNLKFS